MPSADEVKCRSSRRRVQMRGHIRHRHESSACDVLGDGRDRGIVIPALEGRDQFLVVGIPSCPRPRVPQLGDPEETVTSLAESCDRVAQVSSGGFGREAVEFPVRPAPLLGILLHWMGADVLQRGRHPCDQLGRRGAHGNAHPKRLQHDPGRVNGVQLGWIYLADERPLVRIIFDQALFLEKPKGFTQGSPAYTESTRHLRLQHRRSWWEVAADDHLPEFRMHIEGKPPSGPGRAFHARFADTWQLSVRGYGRLLTHAISVSTSQVTAGPPASRDGVRHPGWHCAGTVPPAGSKSCHRLDQALAMLTPGSLLVGVDIDYAVIPLRSAMVTPESGPGSTMPRWASAPYWAWVSEELRRERTACVQFGSRRNRMGHDSPGTQLTDRRRIGE